MPVKSRLGLRQATRLGLSQAMRQSLGVLRLPTQSLLDEIARESEENPFLVAQWPPGRRSGYDVALDTTAATESLGSRLAQQLGLQRLDPVTEAAALYLVGELREDGYLDVALNELSAESGLPEEVLSAGLAALHRCDPPGIGARTLAECLALKLADAGIAPDLAQAAALRLDDFAEERWDILARGLRQPERTLQRIATLLRGLSSAPVSDDSGWVVVDIPEIVIEAAPQGGLAVTLSRDALPKVTAMPLNRATLGSDEMLTLHDRATNLGRAVRARSQTLLRIGRHIAATQQAFFLGEHGSIVPETRAEAARALEMHPSTLGRAIAGKSLAADNRTYAFARFFSHALPGAKGGISPFDVQRRIRALIAGESADSPLADSQIHAHLKNEGVDIARRTVAKYRKCMRIPSSFGRRHRKVSAKSQPRIAHRNATPRD